MVDRPNRADIDYLGQHHKFFGDVNVVQLTELEKGQVIRFMYNGRERNVFVVHPKWKGKLHGLDLKFLPRRPFLTIINTPSKWTEEKLYEMRINKPIIQKWEVFRTYDVNKISNLKLVVYNNLLQPDEHGEQEIDEAEEIQEIEYL